LLRVFSPVGEVFALLARVKLGVFIERDGILNGAKVERRYQVSPLTMSDFHVNLAAAPGLKKLKAAGFLVFATTNQPGLSRGYQSRRELDLMHQVLQAALPIDEVWVCPHDEVDHCPCRKPKPGLLVEAAFKYRLNLEHSYVISDKWQDAEAARSAGCTSILLRSPWLGNVHRDLVMNDLDAAVDKILLLRAGRRVPAA
jgi:D-glycero-D-manno-heptose 1,7-bisphosphate phosphatase